MKKSSRLGFALICMSILMSILLFWYVAVDHQAFKNTKESLRGYDLGPGTEGPRSLFATFEPSSEMETPSLQANFVVHKAILQPAGQHSRHFKLFDFDKLSPSPTPRLHAYTLSLHFMYASCMAASHTRTMHARFWCNPHSAGEEAALGGL